jgi:hypothetical protein
MSGVSSEVQALANQKYQYGFVTDLETRTPGVPRT